MSINELAQKLEQLNAEYRSGNPSISDDDYDLLVEELKRKDPKHPFLNTVEPEEVVGEKYTHPTPMLSTDKSYSSDEVEKWLDRIRKAALAVGITNPKIRSTIKLDGVACRYITTPLLATRGDGSIGRVITSLLDNGLVIKGDSGSNGVGEIVMKQSYFDKHLSHMSHPRSVVSGIVTAKNLNEESEKILADGAVELVLYKDMPNVEVGIEDFSSNYNEIENKLRSESEYPFDGVVFESADQKIREYLGSNSQHNLWQLAKKQRSEGVLSTVTDITYPIGRTSVLTPLIHIEPVMIDGSLVSKMTGHYVGKLIENKVGVGATVSVIKAGEVIPAIQSVILGSDDLNLPTCCPHCEGEIEKRDVQVNELVNGKTKRVTKKEANWFCVNDDCVGKNQSKIIHHFELVKAQLFGKKTVSKLVNQGFNSVQSIYQMNKSDFVSCGLGEGQASNLLKELKRVSAEPIDDYQLIASLGISSLGRSAGKKLFKHYSIDEIQNVTSKEIEAIRGFGTTISKSITKALATNPLLPFLLVQFGSVIVHTKDKLAAKTNTTAQTPLNGKNVVFTGTCSMPRSQMAEMAQEQGCEVQKSVVKGTDYLITGEKVGAKKIESALKKGAKILTEAEFIEMIESPTSVETVADVQQVDTNTTEKYTDITDIKVDVKLSKTKEASSSKTVTTGKITLPVFTDENVEQPTLF
ncbi:BRCT domain-containing protein [Vibrio cyclitrophicus]|uniref:BRCT domain-containing protein n=1 Tax=Vibrio cyclitrophicus TaxID=47951 RepID=UPI0032E37BCD